MEGKDVNRGGVGKGIGSFVAKHPKPHKGWPHPRGQVAQGGTRAEHRLNGRVRDYFKTVDSLGAEKSRGYHKPGSNKK